MRPSIACIVLNWNGWKDTNACLAALSRIDYDNLSVVVIDNGSSDGSANEIRRCHPGITLIENPKNVGFAGGNNVGIKQALKQQAEFIWLLNNDTEPSAASLSKLVEKMQTNERYGAIGSVLMYAHDSGAVQAWGGGRINLWTGRTSHAISSHPDDWFDYITAASILISRSALEDVGLLDEDFFLYWEDTDFSYRLRKRGWKLGVAAESIVLHKENASTSRNRAAFDRYATASCLRFMHKHSPLPWISVPLALALKAANCLRTLRVGRLGAIAAGVRDFYARGADALSVRSASAQSDSPVKGFLVNASRIGPAGGLRTFALDILDCLSTRYPSIEAVLPRETPAPRSMKVHELPRWLGSSSRISILRPLLWQLYALALFPGKKGCRVLSTTHHAIPFRKQQIITLHDLRPYFLPDTWAQTVYFRILLPRSLHRCDGILTVSNASKQDIVSVYGIAPEKIHIVPNAVAQQELAHPVAEASGAAKSPYLLMVGASWPHKNAEELLAMHEFWKDSYRLKIVAGEGRYADTLRNLASRLGIASHVDFLGSVMAGDLHALYLSCAALVYPSRMEGFGLPPLEAMSFGKLTIVSDIPVFRELFGEVPLFVHLGDASSWRIAFQQLAEIEASGDEQRRLAGRDLAAQFSKQRMAMALETALSAIWNPAKH